MLYDRKREKQLSDKVEQQTSTIESLRDSNLHRQEQIKTLKTALEKNAAAIATLRTNVETVKDRLTKQIEANKKQTNANAVLREVIQRKQDALDTIGEKIDEQSASGRKLAMVVSRIWSNFAATLPFSRQFRFAASIAEQGEALGAECYIALMPESIPAALELQRQFGGKVVCDNIARLGSGVAHGASASKSHVFSKALSHAAFGAMRDCDRLLVSNETLEHDLADLGLPTFVLKNVRRTGEPERRGFDRQELGLGADQTVLLVGGIADSGFEQVLEAVASLPESFHLVADVLFASSEDRTRTLDRVNEFDLQGRVHFLSPASERMLSDVDGVDIGIVVTDPTNPDPAALLNRCIDFWAAGIPVVSAPASDVAKAIAANGAGIVVEEAQPARWRESIGRVMATIGTYRDKARKVRDGQTWESQQDDLFAFLGRPKSVTLIGLDDLSISPRYLRLAASLRALGCSVKAAFVSENPDTESIARDVEYYNALSWYKFADETPGVLGDGPETDRMSEAAEPGGDEHDT